MSACRVVCLAPVSGHESPSLRSSLSSGLPYGLLAALPADAWCHSAPWPRAGPDEALSGLDMGELDLL